MGNHQVDNKFTWVIKNFSSLQSEKIYSDQFLIDGCKWRLMAFPKGNRVNYLSLYLEVADFESLPCGWTRHAEFDCTVVNQTKERFSQAKRTEHWFDKEEPDWGFTSMLPLHRLDAKTSEFLMNGEVKVVAEVKVLQVIGESNEATQPLKKMKINDDAAASTPADWVEVNGFQILSSQVDLARRVFETHPETAIECRTKNQDLRTSYMNVLLSLIKMLFKLPQEHSEDDDLSDSVAALAYLKSVGFKLDWLEKKLDQTKENKKKRARVCEMEQELHGLEQKCKDLKTLLDKEKAEILEATAPDLSFSNVV
ncbi:unnamed protein product [Microthlaspi erraticum]|uniref:MATH domain-containing protein n=1 Tax=Microthlaspi erraticum TaxID=1685480 RepID=A0A6D2II98_9BRAS|nr:unnamed protein product [Microthlaspi erraticum]